MSSIRRSLQARLGLRMAFVSIVLLLLLLLLQEAAPRFSVDFCATSQLPGAQMAWVRQVRPNPLILRERSSNPSIFEKI